MPVLLPEVFGRYRILKKLGEGGMGVVYLAEDVPLRRQVAIKVPTFADGESPQIIDRFVREARLAAQIVHPNLCPIHDVGTIDNIYFLTMAFIEGNPLSRLIQPGHPWPARKAVELVRQLANVLQVLHERKIIHRDLKPANVMIRPDESLVLMDFGLARAMEGASQRLTGTAMIGTPNYMAPEQIEADPSSHTAQTDIYALGVILFQLLVSECPFRGSTLELMAQTLHAQPPAPSSLRPELDAELDQLCLWAMNKKPDHRPGSMKEFAASLTGYLDGKPNVPDGAVRVICAGCGKAVKIPAASQKKKLVCPRCRTPLAAKPAVPLIKMEEVSDPPLIGIDPAASIPTVVMSVRSRKWTWFAVAGLLLLAGLTGLWFGRTRVLEYVGFAEPKTDEMTNSIDMKFVRIPAGTFKMGALPTEGTTETNESPQHDVQITTSFWMGAYEVTQDEYKVVMSRSPSAFGPGGKGAEDVRGIDSGRLPVESISWEEAQEFCRRLTARSEEKKKGREYRLPTEAEWEYACRAGEANIFHFGNDLDYKAANFDSEKSYQGKEAPSSVPADAKQVPKPGHPLPVGTYPANRWGLYDMHGNVKEWCRDLYIAEYYLIGPRLDPFGTEQPGRSILGNAAARVTRGGDWTCAAKDCRTAYRGSQKDNVRNGWTGFRVVCVEESK